MQTDNTKKKKDWSLWLGLAIPVVMMLFIAGSVYVPRLFDDTPPPVTDFLYTSNYSSRGNYSVEESDLVWNDSKNPHANGDKPRLFLYDVSAGTTRELSFSDAQKLKLDHSQVSPDGYKVEQSRHNGFFLFDWNSSRDYYLTKGRSAHKVDVAQTTRNYYAFKFLAWVGEGK